MYVPKRNASCTQTERFMSPKRNASGYENFMEKGSIFPVSGVIERDSTFGVMDFSPANYGDIAIGGLQK